MEFQFLNKNILYIILSFSLLSCEKDIDVTLTTFQEKLVVQGHIETGTFAKVSLSRNLNYNKSFDFNALVNALVLNATVVVTDGVVYDTLQPSQLLDNYTVFNFQGTKIKGEVNKYYSIIVTYENEIFEANTKIPEVKPLDSVWYDYRKTAEGKVVDSNLVQLFMQYTDPDTVGNNVRVWTKRNLENMWSSDFISVYDDRLTNNKTITFSVARGKEPYLFNDSTSFTNYGYFYRNDTIYIKWAGIDQAHFNFWRTLETASASTGNPFAAPVVVASNIRNKNGKGLGIWGGYGTSFDTLIVK